MKILYFALPFLLTACATIPRQAPNSQAVVYDISLQEFLTFSVYLNSDTCLVISDHRNRQLGRYCLEDFTIGHVELMPDGASVIVIADKRHGNVYGMYIAKPDQLKSLDVLFGVVPYEALQDELFREETFGPFEPLRTV